MNVAKMALASTTFLIPALASAGLPPTAVPADSPWALAGLAAVAAVAAVRVIQSRRK